MPKSLPPWRRKPQADPSNLDSLTLISCAISLSAWTVERIKLEQIKRVTTNQKRFQKLRRLLMNELLTRLGYFEVHHQGIRSVCWLFVYNVLFKRGIRIALSRVERGTGTYVPEERADRSKGIRGAEDGQSGSRASSPRDSGRRGGIREYGRKEKEHTQQEGRRKGGRNGGRRQVVGT